MAAPPTGTGFRPDIQGLRAVAVMLVVVFHLWPGALPGGYVGVDVFFVISGFLITAHLLAEVERTGSVSVTRFWARRVRRLLPASFLVLGASVALAFAVLPPTLVQQNLTEIAAAAGYVLNWVLAFGAVDYLAADNAPSLVQHYWSLSVEEQFYLVWPVLVIAAVAVAARFGLARRGTIAAALGLVFAASLWCSVTLTATSPALAYFVTPTRAWEFAAGGLAALVPAGILALPHTREAGIAAVRAASWAAAIAIVASALLLDGETPFPGWIALVPVAATVVLLAAGDDPHPWAPQALARIGPVQLLGDTSYAIYLWHWPLIVAAPYVIGHGIGPASGTALLVVTVLLAVATKHLVEDPVRRARGHWRSRTRAFAFMAAGMAALIAVAPAHAVATASGTASFEARIDALVADPAGCFGAYAMTNGCADPYAVTDTVDPVYAAGDQWDYAAAPMVGACTEAAYLDTPRRVGIACRIDGGGPRIALVGDSHAFHLWDAVAGAADREGWSATMHVQYSCSGFESAATAERTRSADARLVMSTCPGWAEEVFAGVRSDPPDLVLLSSRAGGRNIRVSDVTATLRPLQDAGVPLAVIDDVPGMPRGQRGPACVEAAPGRDDPCASDKPDGADPVNAAARELGIPIVSFDETICRGGERCHAVIGGTIVYADRLHLTRTFARTLAPQLADAVERILAR